VLPVLDDGLLAELQSVGTDFLEQLTDIFVEDVPQRTERLHVAVETREADAMWKEAHGLRGSALGVGAVRMAHVCGAIEAYARSGRLDEAAGLEAALEALFSDAQVALKAACRAAS